MKREFILLLLIVQIFNASAQSDSTNASAQDIDKWNEEAYYAYLDSIDKTFVYEYGQVNLGNEIAVLEVPKGYKYLDPQQSAFVLTQLWGNPPGETYGLLLPEEISPISDDFTYAIEISYSEEGYIDDDDAGDIDYDDLLEGMQNDTKEINPERIKQGYEPIEIIGWAADPYYDAVNKKLHWAREIKFGDAEVNTLNYNIRVLGRKGYLNLNAIGDVTILHDFNKDRDKIIESVSFNEGYKYGEFDPDFDKVAAYGIGGLVAGKILAKVGFFALIIKFWKVIAIAVVAGFSAFRKKIFGSKDTKQLKE
jgi:uncharacterized membrane-anchored protein